MSFNYSKKWLSLLLGSILIIVLALYAITIEPYALQNQQLILQKESLPAPWKNTKMIFLSDLNITQATPLGTLMQLVEQINAQKPDLIFLTGDILSNKENSSLEEQQWIESLKKLRAPLGKFAIFAQEQSEAQLNLTQKILNQSEFQILTNTTQLIYNKVKEPINLIALNDHTDSTKAESLLATSEKYFSLAFVFSTQQFKTIQKFPNIQFVFGSATYGGTIGLPLISTLFVTKENRSYPRGLHQQGAQHLLVSNGIGFPHNLPFRLWNRPTFYTVTFT